MPSLSAETKAAIITRYKESNDSLRDLAREFGCSAPTIRYTLMRANVPITGSPYYNADGTKKRAWYEPKKIAQVLAGRMDKKPASEIASETGLAVRAVKRILKDGEIDQAVRNSKGRVAGLMDKALDVAEFHLELNDKGVAMQLIQGSGVLRLTDGADEGNQQRGGIVFNMGLFDAAGTRQLLASLTGNQRPAVLDAELHEIKG